MFVGAGMLILVVLWVATFSHCLAFVIKLTNTIQIGIKRLRQRQTQALLARTLLQTAKAKAKDNQKDPIPKTHLHSSSSLHSPLNPPVFIALIYCIYNFIGSYTNE